MTGATAVGSCQYIDLRFRVIQAAKCDRICRAGLCAGGRELTILDLAPFRFGLIFSLMNALDAESAFFHHTPAANGHIGVELVVQRSQLRMHTIIIEIE